jgi:outer membrane receptor protein involved in Fe transport
LWQPVGALSVRVGALFQNVDSDGDADVALNPSTLLPLAGYQKDNNYLPQPFKSELQYYTLDLNWDLGSAKFVSASGFSNQSSNLVADETRAYGVLFPLFGFTSGLSAFGLDLNTKKITQEFRLSSPSDVKLEWLAGVFYTHEKSSNFEIATAQDFSGAPIVGLNPIALASIEPTYQEYALFGDVTYHLTDRFDVSGGLRYAENDQHQNEVTSGALIGIEDVTSSGSEGVWTYNFSPRLHITKDIMTYIRIASGYQAGAPNIRFPGVPPKVNSDTLLNYEIGLKSEFWDQRTILNVSAFDVQWKDIQVTGVTSSGTGYLTNGGTARSRGLEGEGTLRPDDGLVLEGSIAYTNAELTQDIPSVGGLSGNRLPFIPLWSGSLRADYTQALSSEWDGHLGAGLRLVGDRYASSPNNIDGFKMNAYNALDLNADISNKRWSVGLFAKNLTNTHAYLTDTVIANAASGVFAQVEGVILQPRTIGISLDAKF